MKSKIALFISIALTAFALVTIGGVVTTARSAGQVTETAAPTQEMAVAPTLDPAIQEAFAQREAAYQDLIAQANARLEEAQQTQMALQEQLAALQNTNAPAEVTATISPEDAATIAAQYMGRSDLYSVESTSLYGNTVYKVVFSSGDIVYIGLDGQVIGVAPAQVAAPDPSNRFGRSGGHYDDDDHEHEKDDD